MKRNQTKLQSSIKPIIRLFHADGTKQKYELYNRPPIIYVKRKGEDDLAFERTGPDEYTELTQPLGK